MLLTVRSHTVNNIMAAVLSNLTSKSNRCRVPHHFDINYTSKSHCRDQFVPALASASHYRGEHYQGDHYQGNHYQGNHYQSNHYRVTTTVTGRQPPSPLQRAQLPPHRRIAFHGHWVVYSGIAMLLIGSVLTRDTGIGVALRKWQHDSTLRATPHRLVYTYKRSFKCNY